MEKRSISRLAFVLIALCLVLSFGFVSCDKKDDGKGKNEETDKNKIELLSPDDALSIDGYSIVRSDTSSETIKGAAVDLRTAIKEKCGIDPKLTTDYSGGSSKEILVGNTKRMSAPAMNSDQYQILRQGDRIAILGGSDEAVVNGVKYFAENLLSDKGLLLADGYDYTSATSFTVTAIKIGGTTIKDAFVMTEFENYSYVDTTCNVISSRVGINAESVKNIEKANIIFTSDESLGISEGNWGLVVKDGKLYIVGTTSYEQKAAYDYFLELLNSTAGELALDDGTVHTEKLLTKEEYYKDTQLVIYPEFPEQVRRDYDYKVTVHQGDKSGQIPVYNHTMEFFVFDRGIGGDNYRRFSTFAFSGEQTRVDIKVSKDFSYYSVIPSAKNFKTEFKDGVISVYLDKPDYFMIRLDDDDNSILAVAADYPEYPLDIPAKDDPNVYYVEGWVEPEQGLLELTEPGTILYIAPGSVLNARCRMRGANSQVLGRGAIIDPYENIHEYDGRVSGSEGSGWHMLSLYGDYSKFDGPFLLDARCFNLALSGSYIEVYNYKALSTMMTTDGISFFGGKDHYVEHCINYTADNSFVYGTTGSYVKDSLTGTTCAILFPQGNTDNVTFENIYVFRANDGFINNQYNPGGKELNHNGTLINCDAMDCINLPHFFRGRGMGMLEKPFTFNGISLPALTGVTNPHTGGIRGNAGKLIRILNSSEYILTGNYIFDFYNLYIDGELIEDESSLNNDGTGYFDVSFSSDGNYKPVRRITYNVNYTAPIKVYIGTLQLSFDNEVVKEGNTYYLPSAEILKALRETDVKVKTKDIGGVEYVDANELVSARAAEDVDIDGGNIVFTPNEVRGTLLLPDEGEISEWGDSSPWQVDLVYAEEDGDQVFYMHARSQQYAGGLSRYITEEIKMYGEGTYTLSFMIKSETPAAVGLSVRYDTPENTYYAYGEEVIEIDEDWQEVTATFEVTEEMTNCVAMALNIGGKSNNPTECFIIKNVAFEK